MESKGSSFYKNILPLLLFPIIIFACNDVNDLPPNNEQLLVETASNRENLSLFVQAIDHAGLRQALDEQGPFTIFVPNNEAFLDALRFLGVSSVQNIPKNNLATLLSYHVIPGRILSKQILTGDLNTFLDNVTLNIERIGTNITINDSVKIITRDIESKNGMIHEIDKVLFAPSNSIMDIIENNGFTNLLDATLKTDLGKKLEKEGRFTLFAPNNAAITRFLNDNKLTISEFLNLPNLEDLLEVHVLEGVLPTTGIQAGTYLSKTGKPIFINLAPNGTIWINGKSRVVSANLFADNGIVHVLDYFISSPIKSISELLLAFTNAESQQFRHLTSALVKSGLIENLNRGFEDNITLFAPTDAAFEALFTELGISSIDDIPAPTLEKIIRYHLSPQRIFSQELRQDATLPTLLSGQTINVNLAQLQINDSGLISDLLNIHGKNGVLHGINKVLIPKD